MNSEAIIEIAKQESGRDDITAETALDELGLDSLGLLEFLHLVCSEVKDIPVEKWSKLNTIGDVIRETC